MLVLNGNDCGPGTIVAAVMISFVAPSVPPLGTIPIVRVTVFAVVLLTTISVIFAVAVLEPVIFEDIAGAV
jgi:hypothetical protein